MLKRNIVLAALLASLSCDYESSSLANSQIAESGPATDNRAAIDIGRLMLPRCTPRGGPRSGYKDVTISFMEVVDLTGSEALSRALTGLGPAVNERTEEMAANIRMILAGWPNLELERRKSILELPQTIHAGGDGTTGFGVPLEHPLIPWRDCIADAPRLSVVEGGATADLEFSIELSLIQPQSEGAGEPDFMSLFAQQGATSALTVIVRNKGQSSEDVSTEVCRKTVRGFDETKAGGMTSLPQVVDLISSCALASYVKEDEVRAYKMLWGDMVSSQHLADSIHGIERYAAFVGQQIERGSPHAQPSSLKSLEDAVSLLAEHVDEAQSKATAADYYFLLHASTSLAHFKPGGTKKSLAGYLPRMTAYKDFSTPAFSWFKAMVLQAHGDLDAARREWDIIIDDEIQVNGAASGPVSAMIRMGNIRRDNGDYADALQSREETKAQLEVMLGGGDDGVGAVLRASVDLEAAADLYVFADKLVKPARNIAGQYRHTPGLVGESENVRVLIKEIENIKALGIGPDRLLLDIDFSPLDCDGDSCAMVRQHYEEQFSSAYDESVVASAKLLSGAYWRLREELQTQCAESSFKHEACTLFGAADKGGGRRGGAELGEIAELERVTGLFVTAALFLAHLECLHGHILERTASLRDLERLDFYLVPRLQSGEVGICAAREVWEESLTRSCEGDALPKGVEVNREAIVNSILEDVGWATCSPGIHEISQAADLGRLHEHEADSAVLAAVAMLETAAIAKATDTYYEASVSRPSARRGSRKIRAAQRGFARCRHRGGSLSTRCKRGLNEFKDALLHSAGAVGVDRIDPLWDAYAEWNEILPADLSDGDPPHWDSVPSLRGIRDGQARSWDSFLDADYPRDDYPTDIIMRAHLGAGAMASSLVETHCERLKTVAQSLEDGVRGFGGSFQATGYAAVLSYVRTYDRLASTEPCGRSLDAGLFQQLMVVFAQAMTEADLEIYGGAGRLMPRLRDIGVSFVDVDDIDDLAAKIGDCRTLPGRSRRIGRLGCARRFAIHVMKNSSLYASGRSPAVVLDPGLRDPKTAFLDWVDSPDYGPQSPADGLFWLLVEEQDRRSRGDNFIFDMDVFPRYLVALRKHLDGDQAGARAILTRLDEWSQWLPEVLTLRGWIELNDGAPRRALKYFRRAVNEIDRPGTFYGYQLQGGMARAQMDLGLRMTFREGVAPKAKELIGLALPHYESVGEWEQVVLAYVELHRDADALTILQDRVRGTLASPADLKQYGLLLAIVKWGRGERAEANKVFEQYGGGVSSDLERGKLLVGQRAKRLGRRVVRASW